MFDSFPVCRTIFDHWIYENPDYLKIWITMLGRARYSKEVKKGLYLSVDYELKYAQFIFGRTQWSKDLRIGEQKIRTCIKKMVTDNMILLTTRSIHFSIYEIVNYAKYNHPDYLVSQDFADESNQQLTSWQPADNQLVTTKEEGIRKNKKDKTNIIYAHSMNFFEQFWNAYPKKKSKGQAEKAFAKFKVDEQFLQIILTAIEQAKKSTEWQNENGQFIPYPATWLNAKGWDDVTEQKVYNPKILKTDKYEKFYL